MKRASMTIDVDKGDTILTGRFKNVPAEVTSMGTDANGQPTINGRKALTFRIEKLMPGDKKAGKSACAKFAALATSIKQMSNPTPGQGILAGSSPSLPNKLPSAPNTSLNVSTKIAPEALNFNSPSKVGPVDKALDANPSSAVKKSSIAYQLGLAVKGL